CGHVRLSPPRRFELRAEGHEQQQWQECDALDFVERVAFLPLLLLMTFRPEFEAPWRGEAHVTTMLLGRLGAAERAALVAHVAGTGGLPDRLMEEIARRTDGVPLFLEEMTKAVL